jgi:hypothetical protein
VVRPQTSAPAAPSPKSVPPPAVPRYRVSIRSCRMDGHATSTGAAARAQAAGRSTPHDARRSSGRAPAFVCAAIEHPDLPDVSRQSQNNALPVRRGRPHRPRSSRPSSGASRITRRESVVVWNVRVSPRRPLAHRASPLTPTPTPSRRPDLRPGRAARSSRCPPHLPVAVGDTRRALCQTQAQVLATTIHRLPRGPAPCTSTGHPPSVCRRRQAPPPILIPRYVRPKTEVPHTSCILGSDFVRRNRVPCADRGALLAGSTL